MLGSIFFLASLIAGLPNCIAAPLFGGEFTFSNSSLNEGKGNEIGSEKAVIAQRALVKEMTAKCLKSKTCKIEKITNANGTESYRLIYKPDEFWLQISTDPRVVEVQTIPATAEQFRKHRSEVESLFSSAKRLGLSPNEEVGAGHIHIDIETMFGGDATLFRDFLVDFMNHRSLGPDFLGGDTGNSPHIRNYRSREKMESLQGIIKRFDLGEIKTISQLAVEINNEVYSETIKNYAPPEKYQAFNLVRSILADGLSTVEIRSLNAQNSLDDFLLMTELFEKRVEFLRTKGGRVALKLDLDLDYGAQYDLPRLAKGFKNYIAETGLDWRPYSALFNWAKRDAFIAAPIKRSKAPPKPRKKDPADCPALFGAV